MKVTSDACLFGGWAALEMENFIKKNENPYPSVADIGSGSGLLSLMLAQKNDQLTIEAFDIDMGAILQSEKNFKASSWWQRLSSRHIDVLSDEFSEKYFQKFDIIICNPPFYEKHLPSPSPLRNLAFHDVSFSLEKLFITVKTTLGDDGIFFVLLPFYRLEECIMQANKHGLHLVKNTLVRLFPTQSFSRAMIGMRKKPESSNISTISIKNEENEYSEDFIALMKDYYLFL